MKKRLFSLILLAIMCVTLCACGKKGDKLSVKETVIKLDVGKSHTIELENGNKDDVVWNSDDESVATVSEDGTVVGRQGGVTVIRGKTESSSVHIGVVVKDEKKEYVDNAGNVVRAYEESDIVSITVGVKGGGKNDVTIRKGDTYTLVAYTDPENSKDEISWKSDNTSVVTVTDKGVISAVGKGTAEVKAIAPNLVEGTMIIRVK